LNSVLELAQLQIGRRYRQFKGIWSAKGLRGITDRVRTVTAQRLLPKEGVLPVDPDDVLAADLSRPLQVRIPKVNAGEPLVINWLMVPAEPKSGGHTTIFRMIRYLEAHGYVNRVYFYNVYGGDYNYYKSIVRSFYGFHGQVSHLDNGMEDAHAVVATAWATAYPVFNSRCAGKRFYFAQDYEPYFYPVGAMSLLAENTYRMGFHAITAGRWLAKKLNSEFGMATDSFEFGFYPVGAMSLLAENTYRMGFHAITAGRWLAKKLNSEFGMATDSFEFGCDTSVYRQIKNSKRSGLVFYARPEAARRGYELGLMAMEAFAARCPDIDLHFYGDTMGDLPFRFINHGRVGPDKLNQIYNQCYAGLSLSLTNVSLVPHEMLAAGCIPVVNEAVQNRIVLDNSFVRYAPPYPQALASELEALVMTPDFDSLSAAAAASVRGTTWDDAGATVDGIFRRVLGELSESR